MTSRFQFLTLFLVISDIVSKVYFFGDHKTVDMSNDRLVTFVTDPQENILPDRSQKWKNSIKDCIFLIRIENPLNRLWVLSEYDDRKKYSLELVAEINRNVEMNYEQKMILAAFYEYKLSKDPNIPITPAEKAALAAQNLQINLIEMKEHEIFKLRMQEEIQNQKLSKIAAIVHELGRKIKAKAAKLQRKRLN